MNLSSIIITTLSSSLIAAGLTSLVNYFITSVNYRNEYYKKILDKRLNAYEQVHSFISVLKVFTHDNEENTLTPLLLSNGVEELDKLIFSTLAPIQSSVWLSPQLSNVLTQLNGFLVDVLNEADSSNEPDKELIRIGTNRLTEIRNFRKEIEILMKRDFQTMHKIDKFLLSPR